MNSAKNKRIGIHRRWLGSVWGLIILGTFFVASGCHRDSAGNSSLLPSVTGKPGQVLVVAPTPLGATPLGDTLKSILEAEFEFIPQSEPSFDLTFITEGTFDNALRPFRNILWVAPTPDSASCTLRVAYDRWAAQQAIIYLTGPTYQAMASYLADSAYHIYQLLNQIERGRLLRAYRDLRNEALAQYVAQKYGPYLAIPPGYQIRVDSANFTWISLETPDISQGLLIYKTKNYGDALSRDTLVAHRDAMTRRYVPGPTPGTHMEVSWVIPPEALRMRFGADTVYRVRGFWEVNGHAMGGSFLSYSQPVAGGDSILTVGGYIYAPRFRKRDYIRELDAILLSRFLAQ